LKQPFSFYSVAGVFVGMQCDIEFLCDHTLYRNKHKADARKSYAPFQQIWVDCQLKTYCYLIPRPSY